MECEFFQEISKEHWNIDQMELKEELNSSCSTSAGGVGPLPTSLLSTRHANEVRLKLEAELDLV